jgi:protein arginine kinase
MSNELLDKFILNPIRWLNEENTDENIVLSSRIRLSRNISNIPFPVNASEIEKKQVFNTISSAVKKNKSYKNFEEIEINNISEIDKQFLLERKLITDQLNYGNSNSYLMVDKDESIQVMINEEDHIKIQMIKPGMSLRKAWKEISIFDSELGKNVPFAFDKSLGYLTSSPLEVGTGMKASVMLNLPALTLAKQIDAVIKGLNKLGLSVNGFKKEKSAYIGYLYQISNQSTLGELEEQIIERIENIVNQIVLHEKNARLNLLEKKKEYLLNTIGRAYGILRYSYILTSKEALGYLSILRMGVDLKMFNSIDFKVINDLLISVQNAHLQKYTGMELGYSELDILRADLIRNRLQL